MITINEIRALAKGKEFNALRDLHNRAKIEGIENCDEQQLSTLNLCILECSMFKDRSQGHLRSLFAMLDAAERGNHPYDDIITMSTLSAEAVIAQAQLNAVISEDDKPE